jgi:hypothetical protein
MQVYMVPLTNLKQINFTHNNRHQEIIKCLGQALIGDVLGSGGGPPRPLANGLED